MLLQFEPFSETEISSLIKASKKTTCPLDPVPTQLLLELMDILLPVVTQLVNGCLSAGVFPDNLKQALLRPLLKKNDLDSNQLKHYRPVSNLSYISKIIERAVDVRLRSHMTNNSLLNVFQSAYRANHSTETALLSVVNHLRIAVDNGNIAALVLLDLSAAFDTVDHHQLMSVLAHDARIGGAALELLRSYLSGRGQSVIIGDQKSDSVSLVCGVPQGSVLGPLLFILYTNSLDEITQQHNVDEHSYADDTQLMKTFRAENILAALGHISDCTLDIKSWMTSRKLKLNDEKTEAILIGTKHNLRAVTETSLTVGQSSISFSPKVKSLGVVIDSNLTMEAHVDHLCRSCYFHLRAIGQLRNNISTSAAKTLVQSLVLSRLDFGNSLLWGASKQTLQRLQLIQNTAARIVSRTSRSSHISPVLKALHWLPVESRIKHKLLCLTYKCQHGLAPAYLSNLLQSHKPTRSLRSANQHLLTVPQYKLSSYGLRSFSVAAPKLWNDLPLPIRLSPTFQTFKARLKTHLFQVAYTC